MRVELWTLTVLAVAIVFSAGCSSSNDGKNSCSVVCPEGTYCDKDRCLPICAPPCGPSEYCGADRKCHEGPEPDGGVVVPPVDAGVKLDSNGSKEGGPKQDSHATPKPDTVNPNQVLCDCLAKQPKQAYCYKQAITCSKASDCCQQDSTITCGIYGNKHACVGGKCQRVGCQTTSECVTYAQLIKQADAADYTCHTALCPGTEDYCALAVKSCSKASDCCTSTGKSPCGVYPNHYGCDGGKCKYVGCTSNSECVTYAQLMGVPDANTWTCKTYPCLNTGYCTVPGKSCTTPSDCCVPNSAIPCGTYGNRYRCESGECVIDSCKDKQDCYAFASGAKLPDADKYNCITIN